MFPQPYSKSNVSVVLFDIFTSKHDCCQISIKEIDFVLRNLDDLQFNRHSK
jgi:hypothetical protein